MDNPKKALAAISAAPAEVAGLKIYPVTLAMVAVLEQIQSPLMRGVEAATLGAMAPTIYAMTRPARESLALLTEADGRARFDAAAAEWADTVPAGIAVQLVEAVWRQTGRAMGVLPEGDGENPTSAATAG